MKLDDQHLLGITLYRTPEPVRIRALAAAVHGRNRALASDLLIAARDLERQVPPTIIVIEQEGARMAKPMTQADWAARLEVEIRAQGLDPDAPEAWPIWDAYERRGHTRAAKVLAAITAATPADRSHIPAGALGVAPAGVERNTTLQTFKSLGEDMYDVEDQLHDWQKALGGRPPSFDQAMDLEDIVRAADQIALRAVALGVQRPAPIKSGVYHHVKSIFSAADDGPLYAPGAAVKAIGNGKVEGYLIRYNTPDLSMMRDIFLKSPATDYGRRRTSDAYVHHRLLSGLGERMLTNEAQLEPDEVGIFCKLLLDIGDQYEAAMYKLTQQGKLGWSSGTAPHLVSRKANGDGTHTIKRWILGLDASLTPAPAGGKGMAATAAMKSMLLDAGVDLRRAPQPQPKPRPQDAHPGSTSGSNAVDFDWKKYTGRDR